MIYYRLGVTVLFLLNRWRLARNFCADLRPHTEREHQMTTKTELNEGANHNMQNLTGDQIVRQNTTTNQTIKPENNPKPETHLGNSENRQGHKNKDTCRQPKRSRSIHQTIPIPRLPWNRRLRTPKRTRLPPNMDSVRGQTLAPCLSASFSEMLKLRQNEPNKVVL